MNTTLRHASRAAALSATCAVATLMSGCFGMDFELPPVTLTLPIAENAAVPAIAKNGDKLSFELPELCDLPDLAALEQEVRDAAGPLGGLIEIKTVTLDVIDFEATQGNFDFLDTLTLTFTKDDTSVSLDADLSAQSNITAFELAPGEDEEVDILGLIPGPNECVQASFDFDGSIPNGVITYNASMDITIRATLHL
jgi:hypothetical protein